MKHTYPICLCIGLLCGSVVAQAGGLPEGMYVGGSIGSSNSNANSSNLITDPARCVASGAACNTGTSGTAGALYAGYPISPKLALEAEYADLGKITGTVVQGGINDHYTQKTTGVGLSLVGKAQPLATQPLNLYAKAGVFHWVSQADGSFSPGVTGFGLSTSRKDNGNAPTLGVGAEYGVAKHWTVRAGFDRYFRLGKRDVMLDEGTSSWRTLNSNVDVYSVGAAYHF